MREKLIFVGNAENGYFVTESAKQLGYEVEFIDENSHIKEQVGNILAKAKSNAAAIIYDTTQYIDEVDQIISSINEIKKANGVRPIIITKSLSSNNVIAQAAIEANIKSIISSAQTASDKKEDLIKILTDFWENNTREEIQEIEEEKRKEKDRVESLRYKTIGVAGTYHRLGTTTQCIQIAKYLSLKGYSSCIIDVSQNTYLALDHSEKGYIDMLISTMQSEAHYINEEAGIVRIYGVDFLYKPENVNDVLKFTNYDYYIYDYGVYTDNFTMKMAFTKDYINIFNCGFDTTITTHTIKLLQNSSYNNAKLLFSFVDDGAKEDVYELLKVLNSNKEPYFADYSPNPFQFSNVETFDRMLNIEEKPNLNTDDVKKKKGFSLFKKRR